MKSPLTICGLDAGSVNSSPRRFYLRRDESGKKKERKKERNRVKTSINNYSLNILYFHNVFLGCVKLMQLRFLSFKVFPILSDYNPHVRPDNPVLIWRLELMERRDGSCLTVSCSWSRRPPPRCSHRSMICLILRENK